MIFSVHDEGNSRNVSCVLNYIDIYVFIEIKDEFEK